MPPIDLVYPLIHGQNGEDGSLQGLARAARLPLVGCDTLGSATALDKDVAFSKITAMKVIEKVGRMKYIVEDEFEEKIQDINREMDDEFAELMGGEDDYA